MPVTSSSEGSRATGLARLGWLWRNLLRPLAKPLSRRWWSWRRVLAALAALIVLAGAVTWYVQQKSARFHTHAQIITVHTGPNKNESVGLDSTLYIPSGVNADHPAPAVLLAHGFGSTKTGVAATAQKLARDGYVVLTWTAEGFGDSGGTIHLDSPDYEVTDARQLIDWLSQQPEVKQDGPHDPRVAIVGGSYGGALALLTAGYDQRVDAIVPQITWNSLPRAFFPQSDGGPSLEGVFKRLWVGTFFGSIGRPQAEQDEDDPQCGRFAPDVCRMYLDVATAGRATDSAISLLQRSSPATVLNKIHAPTLLIQGLADSLFPLSEANANAHGIAKHGTPVRVAWFSGGHDGGNGTEADQERTDRLTHEWLDHYLRGAGKKPASSFTYSRVAGVNANTGRPTTVAYSAPRYPGLSGNERAKHITVSGQPAQIANPPNDTPAGISALPGLGSLSALAGSLPGTAGRITGEVKGQYAAFDSKELSNSVDVVGAPRITIRAASPTGEAVLFVKLYDVAGDRSTLPDGLIAPVRLTNLPRSIADAKPETITLPGIVHRFPAGHRLRLVIATSDEGYSSPRDPVVYTVGLGTNGNAASIELPQVAASVLMSESPVLWWLLGVVVAVIAIGLATVIIIARWRRHRHERIVVPSEAAIPLVVRGLRKTYRDGFVAVADVSFTVAPGQVLGLLGPNGAGKTTSLRVLLGLTTPTAGEVLVFGHRLTPGSPVLSQLGALVESPGFLPHLSGMDNLRLYWRATGRPETDAHFDEVCEIAALGDALSRKVRTYSHGMRQRLAIAQAMLGLPRVLILDEPTDGLDPPQIAEMRTVLRSYATGDRAVLVSSHLLAEVEQACTHVVVVNRGRSVAAGPVADVIGDSPSVQFEVSDPDTAASVLAELPGVRSVERDDGSLVADLGATPRRVAVAALVEAGVGVDRVNPRRRLEDAFLALVNEADS